jgi:pimeloyl-ACP methyl ester carboxylesterase
MSRAAETDRSGARKTPSGLTVKARDGTSLYYELTGGGRSMLLLDGLACHGFIWRRLTPYFSGRALIVHPHYRGHGRSGRPRTPQTRIMHLVEDIVMILEREKIKETVVVGHSMGVEVALELARIRYDLVKGLVLINGGYGKMLSTFQDTDMAVHLLPLFKYFERHYPDGVRFFWKNFPVSFGYKMALRLRQINPVLAHKEDLVVYLKHLKRVEPSVFLSLLEEIQYHDATTFLADVSVPALIIAGEKDLFTPVQLARTMATSMPNADLLVVKGATHIAPLEIPELVNLAIEKFMLEKCKVV